MRYLIDTNIWIYYLKRPFSTVRTRLAEHPINDIAVCSVVLAELLHGARKYEDCVTRESILQTTLSPFNNLDFDLAAARHYADIRHDLKQRGLIIGNNDLMIAAIALANDLTVVTHNVDEFKRVHGLRIEDLSV
jgi:tRNA(fMet)-specific endonuclease VapC